jgi:hypothetical protein
MVLPFAAFEAVHSVDRDERQAHKRFDEGDLGNASQL